MNSRVIDPALTVCDMQRHGSVRSQTVKASGRDRSNIRLPQRECDTKPQQAQPKAALINVAQTMQIGCKPSRRKQLVADHAPCQTVAHRAHSTRGNGSKAKAENNHKETKPAAPFSILYRALKSDNVEKSAAKQPAPEYRGVVMRKGLERKARPFRVRQKRTK